VVYEIHISRFCFISIFSETLRKVVYCAAFPNTIQSVKILMRTIIYALIISSISVLASCSKSGTKALERGNFYDAVLQSAEKLRKDSDNSKAVAVLPEAYRNAQNEFLRDIERTRNANQQFRWEAVLDYYAKLNTMQNVIDKCMACRRLVNPQSYFREEDEARENAAAERYAVATDLMRSRPGTLPSRETARTAYGHFERIASFAPNYRDVQNRLNEALNLGSYHVVLEQSKINSRLYQYSNEYFQSKIDEFLRTNRRMNKFVQFYSPQEARSAKLNPDQVVRLEFIDFVVGETNVTNDRLTVISKDSVKTGEATVNGKKVPVYGKVKAQVVRSHKAVRSRGILSLEIFDYQTNKILLREDVPGEFTWVNDWVTYNGDERALSPADKALAQGREELPPPPQQLFIEFTKPIYDQVTSRIKRFYDRY
jgi:ribosomal protein L21